HRARSRAGIPEQDPQKRALAGAVQPDDTERCAFGHAQLDPVERLNGRAAAVPSTGECLRYFAQLDHWREATSTGRNRTVNSEENGADSEPYAHHRGRIPG